MPNELTGEGGELKMVVTIKRAATGKEETVELTSTITDEQARALGLLKESDDGSHAQERG